MIKDFKVPIYLLIFIVVLIIISAIIDYFFSSQIRSVEITTTENEYKTGAVLVINIKNNSDQKICFSSCYPYYFEQQNQGWKSYSYASCPKPDLNENCTEPRAVKSFEIILPALQNGVHRLAVPVCIGCVIRETFKEQKWFYSNEFVIK